MATTPVYGFPYQSRTDSPAGHTLGEGLAVGIETVITRMDTMPTSRCSPRTAPGPSQPLKLLSGCAFRCRPVAVPVVVVRPPPVLKCRQEVAGRVAAMPNPYWRPQPV